MRLCDLQGQLISIFKGHTNTFYSVAFSPDGRYIVSGSWDSTVRLWDRELKVEKLLKMGCNQLREHRLLAEDKEAGDTCLKMGDWSNDEKQEFRARREALAAQKQKSG